MKQKVYCGVDVGSTAVRVGVMDKEGNLLDSVSAPIGHRRSTMDHRFVTQSSAEIVEKLESCLDALALKYEILSIAFAATCSLVVMKTTESGELVPYPANYGFTDPEQNVVFWMDTRAEEETKEINRVLEGSMEMAHMGGSFLEEMGLAKAKYILDHAPKEDVDKLVLFDLHGYLSNHVSKTRRTAPPANTRVTVGIDGELNGWTAETLNKLGMSHLTKDKFKALRIQIAESYSPVPLAGTIIGEGNRGKVLQGVIDSYGGWLGSCSKEVEGTLTMVAGTSTCYVFAHKNETPIRGLWGPFQGFFDGLLVSSCGHATTGKLIEHLFETHPAYQELKRLGPDVFESLEKSIEKLEKEHGQNVHFLCKHMFFYGDLSGNRTPYMDASMRGAFIGESTDISLKDLVLKYVCILEFLAFQTRQTLSLVPGIKKLVICGSQAKNSRFVALLALVTGVPVEVNNIDPTLAGVRGACLLASLPDSGVGLLQHVGKLNPAGKVHNPPQADLMLQRLLEAKYKVMIDMAERQLLYKKQIDAALE